jgi:signal transduction histidine kinase
LFGKPINPVRERISLCRMLEGIRGFLEPVADPKRIRVEAGCDSDCYALADHELLNRMLVTLVLHALRETPMDGTVRLWAYVAGCDILIEVEDTAPGIHDEALDRIFDPMFSSNTEGFGLGLPVVRQIVESHDGQIQVQSSAVGTSFKIRLRNATDGECRNTEVVSESTAGCR